MDHASVVDPLVQWRTAGSLAVATVATLVLSGGTTLLAPLLVAVTAALVGKWVPLWAFALPPAVGALVGGATAGAVQGERLWVDALVGGVATALGVALVGVGVGLVGVVVLMGMTPTAHPVDPSEPARVMTTLGAAAGALVGALLGAVGGAAGHAGRRRVLG